MRDATRYGSNAAGLSEIAFSFGRLYKECVERREPFEVSRPRSLRYPAMKSAAIALTFIVALAAPALGAPGDPRLIQGKLEWPPALSGNEPFIILRGDDGRVYYADVMAAQRYTQGTLSAGSPAALIGLESTKPHEIIAVALGSGDTAALSLALAQVTQIASSTALPPSALPAPPAPPLAPAAAPSPLPPQRLEEGRPPQPGDNAPSVTIRGTVYGLAGQSVFIRRDDGRVVVVDIAKLDPTTAQRLRPGSPVVVVAVPVANKFQATGLMEQEPSKPVR